MFILSACALCATLALAPSPSPSPSASPVPDIAHVYTSDRTDVTLKNTARTIYVVTHDQIVRGGYRTIAGALSALPAVQISPQGPIGSNANFTVRGSSSAQVLVLIDGLPAPGSFSNTVELGNLPTTGVDRIEVVEGGGSTLYGTGAIGGVINIITQRSGANGATVRDGSFADRSLEINTDHVQYVRILADNGYGLPDGGARPDTDYESSALHLDGEHTIGSFDAAVRALIESDHLGAPGPQGTSFSPTSRENDLNEAANLTLTHKSAQAQATLQFGGTNQQILFTCDANDPNCFFPTGTLSTEGRVNFGARNVVGAGNEQLLYGVDLSRGVVRSDSGGFATPPISENAMAQTAGYVQEHFDASGGSFYAGLRAERDGGLGGVISPSAGFVLRLSNDASLKGNLANAFRAPNAGELYYPGFGNPDLKSERASVADLTIVDAHVLGGASVGWFGNRTNDLIVDEPVKTLGPDCIIDPTSFNFQPCNIDHALIEGLTLNVRTPQYNGFTTSLNITDLYRAQNLDTQARLSNDPVISANLRLDFASRSASSIVDSLGGIVGLAGAREPLNTTLPLYAQSIAYTNVDAYLRLRAGRELLVTLRAYNIGNERYAAVSGYPLPGRSFALELTTR